MQEAEIRAALDEVIDDDEERKVQEAHFFADRLPPKVKSVCVVGGGTAGYLTAIALKSAFSDLEVTLVEATDVPIIDVGEATIDNFPRFLQGLGVDIVDLYREVRPTWKLGIRFEWGGPGSYYFNAPYTWNEHGIGLTGSLHYEHGVNAMNLTSVLMHQGRAPVFEAEDGTAVWPGTRYAYHLNNAPFVEFLRKRAAGVGVVHRSLHVSDAQLGPDGNIAALHSSERISVEAEFFVDCTGFRSLLLEQALGARFHPFNTSLFTDRALAFKTPHGGALKPYTTARTMDAGWCWIVPQEEEDHCGYVFSSAFCSADQARQEIRSDFPEATEPRLIEFRSGRHDRAWIANTFAVGNSYGFVEPLESTGLLMIQAHVEHLISVLRAGTDGPAVRHAINTSLERSWDSIRWFLAIHFRFNHRRKTPFWKAAHSDTDIGDLEPIVDIYRRGAPLILRNYRDFDPYRAAMPQVGGLAGLDILLLGQQVPTRLFPPIETETEWRRKRKLADRLAAMALPMAVVLKNLREQPDSLVEHARDFLSSYTL